MHRGSTLCYVRFCGITNCQQGIPKVRLPLMPRERARERCHFSQHNLARGASKPTLSAAISAIFGSSVARSFATFNSLQSRASWVYTHDIRGRTPLGRSIVFNYKFGSPSDSALSWKKSGYPYPNRGKSNSEKRQQRKLRSTLSSGHRWAK
jgi:hypothetical protein